MLWLHSSLKEIEKNRELYNSVLQDISAWYMAEIRLRPLASQIINNVQTNALLNFITFDLHTLVTRQGQAHMLRLLQANETTQTVMIRLKDLVSTLYIKYGTKEIDTLRKRVYKTINDVYGLTFDCEKIDVNLTLWLYPFFKHIYNSIPLVQE